MSDEVQYCWGDADPTQVQGRAPILPDFPDLTPKIMKSFDWPDERDRRDYRVPVLPSTYEDEMVHEACPRRLAIRQRGRYWWINEQIKLEDKILRGRLNPVVGAFYVFLEDAHTVGYTDLGQILPGTDPSKEPSVFIVRHGNVFMYDEDTGYHWGMKTVVFPEGHPDADVPPYQMVDVIPHL